MQKEDLTDADGKPVELDQVEWREYHVRTLVAKDTTDADGVDPKWWAEMVTRIAEKAHAGKPMTMQEWLMWDIFRSWEDDVRQMGPAYRAVECERGHVVAEDDLTHDAEDNEVCEACMDEAVSQAESRAGA